MCVSFLNILSATNRKYHISIILFSHRLPLSTDEKSLQQKKKKKNFYANFTMEIEKISTHNGYFTG